MTLQFHLIARLNAARADRQKRQDIRERLRSTMKPNPQSLRNRYAQLSPERQAKLLPVMQRVMKELG